MEYIWGNLFNIVEMINYILAYRLIFQMKPKKGVKKYIIFFTGLVCLQSIVLFANLNIQRFDIELIYGLLIPIWLLQDKKIKGICMYLNVMQATTIFNICIIRMGTLLMHRPYLIQEINSLNQVLQNAIFSIFSLLLCGYFKLVRKRDIPQVEYTKSHYIFMTLGIFGTAMMIGSVEAIMKKEDAITIINVYECFTALTCIIFIAVIIWLSFSIKKNNEYKKEKDMLELYMEKQEEYIQTVVDKDIQMRKFRHDISGHLVALHSLVNVGNLEKITEYINEIENKVYQSQLKRYSGINAVDAIINDMYNRMQEKDIELLWEGTIPSNCCITIYDLCTVFINIMQNGMDACEELCGEKTMKVAVNDFKGKLYITEINKMCGEILLDDNGNPITNKKDKKNHGLGCKNIREVVEKYNGKLKYNMEDGYFKIEIMI